MTRERIAALVACLGMFVIGGLVGRASKPAHVVTVDHSEEVTRLRSQVASLTQENTSLKRHTVKKTVRTFAPTGKPATETVTEDTHVDKVSGTTTSVHASTDVHSAKLTDSRTETTNRPDWKISVLVGIDSRSLSPVYGGQLSRRLLGPFSAGVWAVGSTRSGVSGGLSLSVEF